MKKTGWFVLLYGISLIVLGYLGYQEGSQASLYAGVGSGAVLVVSAWLMIRGEKFGGYVAFIVSAALTAVFSIRYSNTGKQLPALLAVYSAIMLLTLLKRVIPKRK